MEKIENMRTNEKLKPSMGDDISDALLGQLLDTKELIEKRQKEGNTVALVHLSGDLMHSSHIQYMNTIRAKLESRLGLEKDKLKLCVGVEADSRTEARKGKSNVNKEQERVYNFGNLKAVDHAFVEFEGVTGEMENEERPAGIVKYLDPDIMVSHEEHISTFADYLSTYRRMKQNNENTKVIIVNYKDNEKYLKEKSKREEYRRSTTNTIKEILSMYKDHKKYK